MGFLNNFRQDPLRAIGRLYNQRIEKKRLRKRAKSKELFLESRTLEERLHGGEHNPYLSRYRQIVKNYEERKKERTIENKAVKPWLFTQVYGIPRMVDCMDLRRLAETPIAQLCISTKRSFIKNTPWMIVETDPSEKQLKRIKSKIKDKKERRRIIRRIRIKEVTRIMELPIKERIRDKRFRELRKKALDDESPQNPIIEEVSQLLASPNNTNRPFSHYTSMSVGEMEEVGNATWVLKFLKGDLEEVVHQDGNFEYTRPKSNAKPVEFDAFDNLQFNKDEDKYGNLLGYYHFPRGWMMGAQDRPRYMSKGEIVWFEADPRPTRPYGVANTEKAAPDLDLNQLLLEQITSYAAEGLQSPGMLSLKGEGWTPEEFDKFKTYMQEEVKGHPEVFPIVDKDAEWIPFTQNFRESQYLERELWRTKNIAGQYQMNMTVIGLEDDATNRATAFAHISLALDLKGAGPTLKDIEHAINTQIVWKYFSKDKRVSFIFDPAMNAEEKERLEVAAIRKWESGLITKDEARSDMGHVLVGSEDGGDDFREDGGGADQGLGLGGGGYNPRSAIQDGGSNFNKTLKKKERISISKPGDAPAGANVETGPRGGLYYESTGGEGETEDGGPRGEEVKPDTRDSGARQAEETKKMKDHLEALKKDGIDTSDGSDYMEGVEWYTSNAYSDINRVLRGENPEKYSEEEINTWVEKTSEFLEAAPKYEGETYRGMRWDQGGFGGDTEGEFDEFLSQFQEGAEVSLGTFTSTSVDEETAKGYMKSDTEEDARILFKIQSPSGVYLDGVSNFPNEEEVLLDHSKQYEVVEVLEEESAGGRTDPKGYVITLREVA